MGTYFCTMRGTIQTATIGEIFQHSLAVTSAQTQSEVCDTLESAFRTNFGTSTTLLAGSLGAGTVYTEVTAALINDLTGTTKPVLQAATHKAFSPTLPGLLAGSMLPAQNAVAVSLTGGLRPNGTPYRGRFYLPPGVVGNVGTDGLLLSTIRTRINTWAAQYLNALKGAGVVPCVWSRSLGALTPVTSVRTGDRIDTIRSRRNKGVEAYISAVIT